MLSSSRFTVALLAGSLAMASTSFTAHAQERPGINYDESKAGGLPNLDPLTASDGTKITTKEQWLEKRKPELMKLFEREVYGKTPDGQGIETKAELVGKDTAVFDGKAIRRQVKLTFTSGKNGYKASADLLIYIPRGSPSQHPPS